LPRLNLSDSDRDSAAPSRIAIMSGGVITCCLLLVFLVF